jgi:serine/threonine-protein kinase
VVSLDGSARGVTPIVLSGLSAGTHEIVITRGGVSVSRTIELAEGEARVVSAHLPGTAGGRATATVAPSRSSSGRPIVASEPAASNQGWVNFETPLDLQVFSDGRLIGNTRSGRIALPAGSHDLLLASTQLEYRHMVSVTAQTGRTVASVVPVATGLLSVNALPWAEVSVDGTSVGTTPLANLSLPIGTHEVVWRHPTLGDRRQTVVVKAKTPARIGVDLSRDR